MKYRIAAVPGDGIGPEIGSAALEVMHALGEKFGHEFQVETLPAGGSAIALTGEPLPKSTLDACLETTACAGRGGRAEVGESSGRLRPERALLGIRKAMNLYAILRPARLMPVLKARLPAQGGDRGSRFDMLIVRELTGGMYFGKSGRTGGPFGRDRLRHRSLRRGEVERIAAHRLRGGGEARPQADQHRQGQRLESSRLWRRSCTGSPRTNPEWVLRHAGDNAPCN